MLQQSGIKVLLALQDTLALSALGVYLRTRDDCRTASAREPVDGLMASIEAERPDLLVLEADAGVETLRAVRRSFPKLPVVAVISAGSEAGFQVARLGAVEILTLPLTAVAIAAKLDRLIAGIQAGVSEGDAVVSAYVDAGLVPPAPTLETFAGSAPSEFPDSFRSTGRMAEVRELIEKVAPTNATVLIRGESGVGKEIVARMIFARSERNLKPFVKINCAAIPNDLLESELFGFEAGAFTGAQRAKPGKFQIADGGTLFLDEIGEMHPMLQAKLLHVLQDGEFSRLGSKHDTAVDVRVICATNKLLEQRVAQGLFREDLFYRINVVTVHIPPLRERPEEISVLLSYFIRKYASVYRRPAFPLDDEVVHFLQGYSWPGNIRELENLCKRYVIVGGASQIVRELGWRGGESALGPPSAASGWDEAESGEASLSLLDIGHRAAWQAEKEAIQAMLIQTHWNRKEAARRLRVSYKALLNKIEQMAVEDGTSKGHPDVL